MNINANSHFANVPSVNIPRSRFDRSYTLKSTWKNGSLIPIYTDCTIMPGDTVNMNMSALVRMTTPLVPVMDNCTMDVFFFFVPYRLIWDHFREFMGENLNGPWTQEQEYEIPQITSPCHSTYDVVAPVAECGWKTGTLADYLTYPVNNNKYSDTHFFTKKDGTQIEVKSTYKYEASALPFRAYCLIWNEWFRDQNTQTPCYISKGDQTLRGHSYEWKGDANEFPNGTDNQDSIESAWYKNEAYVKYAETGALPLNVNKFFDIYTACLPQPQKHDAIHIPLSDDKPDVIYGKKYNSGTDTWTETADTNKKANIVNNTYDASVNYTPFREETNTPVTMDQITELNVDLSQALGATVTQIRQAFAIQRFYERQAMGGSRYIEQVRSHFHVTNPDFRVQRPEYLGGYRTPISMNQVIATQESATQPLGYAGGYSVTSDSRKDLFTHSFTEHGILMGLMCCRCNHSYQNGLPEQFSKKKLFDFYWPEMANLSNSPILKKQLFIEGGCPNDQDDTDWYYSWKDDEAFGYQEAWANERYNPDQITGMFRSNYPQSFDMYHYADYYTEHPQLSADWMRETDENIKRTLTIQEGDQFDGDFYFKAIYTRPMPLYSVPGLVDHY